MKKVINVFYSLYAWIVLAILFHLAFLISFIISFGRKNKECIYNKTSHFITKFFFKAIGIKIMIYGQEHVPKNEPVIFISNHQSFLDINLLHSVIEVPFSFISKKEVFWAPIVGWHMKLSGHLPIDRENKKDSYMSLETIINKTKEKSIVMFPEGTRSKDGALGSFKRGAMVAILKARKPVVPVAIKGSNYIMPKTSILFNFFNRVIKVKFGEPIFFSNTGNNERTETINIMDELKLVMERLLESIN